MASELPLFAVGLWLYCRVTTAIDAIGRWAEGHVTFLLVIYAANPLGRPPPSVVAIARTGQAQWFLVI